MLGYLSSKIAIAALISLSQAPGGGGGGGGRGGPMLGASEIDASCVATSVGSEDRLRAGEVIDATRPFAVSITMIDHSGGMTIVVTVPVANSASSIVFCAFVTSSTDALAGGDIKTVKLIPHHYHASAYQARGKWHRRPLF